MNYNISHAAMWLINLDTARATVCGNSWRCIFEFITSGWWCIVKFIRLLVIGWWCIIVFYLQKVCLSLGRPTRIYCPSSVQYIHLGTLSRLCSVRAGEKHTSTLGPAAAQWEPAGFSTIFFEIFNFEILNLEFWNLIFWNL